VIQKRFQENIADLSNPGRRNSRLLGYVPGACRQGEPFARFCLYFAHAPRSNRRQGFEGRHVRSRGTRAQYDSVERGQPWDHRSARL
jgi:hypothetical protein